MHILANLDVFLFHKYLMLEKKKAKCNMVPPIIILKISAYALVSKYIAYGLDKQNCLMNNFREVNDDILKDWLDFREEMVLGVLTKEDKKHLVYFDEVCENILKNVPKQNQKYVKNQLDRLDKNFMDYICYWNEKYYRNEFCDGVQLVEVCTNE